ncbi:MAG: short chain dehydrogenase [Kiritimatiellae bacterium]|nr:short chain dehydrogenase [Kiritimatiellia bacterium]
MKIIIVGASGRIGKEVDKAMSDNHDIVRVGARSGDVQCDYTDIVSVRAMFEKIGQFDSLISAAGGDSTFKPFNGLEDQDYRYGFERKFLDQVRLLKFGEKFVRDNGSFVFTSGFLSHYPNPASIATGSLNAAVDAFVKNTAPLLNRSIRLNVVSPAPIVEPG